MQDAAHTNKRRYGRLNMNMHIPNSTMALSSITLFKDISDKIASVCVCVRVCVCVQVLKRCLHNCNRNKKYTGHHNYHTSGSAPKRTRLFADPPMDRPNSCETRQGEEKLK